MGTLTQWITTTLSNLPAVKTTQFLEMDDLVSEFGYSSAYSELMVRRMAFHQCVNLVANAVSCCEFKTFIHGEEVKGDEYYRWNYEPNANMNRAAFMDKFVTKLYEDNEVLVVSPRSDGALYVADSWNILNEEKVLKDHKYNQVSVDGFTMNKVFKEEDVLHLQLNEENMRPLIEVMYKCYEEILEYSLDSYKRSRGEKGVLTLPTTANNDKNAQTYITNIQKDFTKFSSVESAVLPLYQGMSYEELGKNKYQIETSRDIRAQMDDIVDYTARAFQIPPVLLSGTVEGLDDAVDQFLTFCVDPLCRMIQEEINRKVYGKRALEGDFMLIDTTRMRHIDLLSVATNIDKLIASGAYTINEVRELIGSEPVPDEIGDLHWLTKNYANIKTIANVSDAQGAKDALGYVPEQMKEGGEGNVDRTTTPKKKYSADDKSGQV